METLQGSGGFCHAVSKEYGQVCTTEGWDSDEKFGNPSRPTDSDVSLHMKRTVIKDTYRPTDRNSKLKNNKVLLPIYKYK